jgi:hypothetical protein
MFATLRLAALATALAVSPACSDLFVDPSSGGGKEGSGTTPVGDTGYSNDTGYLYDAGYVGGYGDDGGNTPGGGTGCGPDEYCNFDPGGAACAAEDGRPTDPDCNTAIKGLGDTSNKFWDPGCECNYWGGICEAIAKCANAVCLCDTDCTTPDGALESACVFDFHCDTFCPTGEDPDCSGEDDGKWCESAVCDDVAGVCEIGCDYDADCAHSDACQADGYCDSGCPGLSDPDC